MDGVQEVAGSNPVFPTFHKPLPFFSLEETN